MFDLVIFDCDGVLVDSERLAIKVDVAVLSELGWQISESEVIERFVGVSDAVFKSEVEAHLGISLPDDWDAQVQPRYREVFRQELKPVDGIIEALERLSIPTCVASSGSHEKIRFTLGLTGLYEHFKGRIFSVEDVIRGKPAPDLFLHAARSMNARPEACAVIEDSAIGATAARAAGMQVFAFSGSVTPALKLAGPGTVVFESMSGLPALLEGAA